ncbi:MAG: hypothetical protein AAF985_20785 [Bacteroidota bacterium]
MKFLESTHFFVRTINYDFVASDKQIQLRFRLLPMIHIGSESYYEQVFQLATACDEIFYEGLRLPYARLNWVQYKNVADKLGLVTQREQFKYKQLKDKLVHADLDLVQSKKAWKALRLYEQINLALIDPLRFFIWHQGITRARLAATYMTSVEEANLAYGPVSDEQGTAENLVMTEREQVVHQLIEQKVRQEARKKKTIGILYGAAHMDAFARCLIDRFRYIPLSGTFTKVFEIG